MVTRQSDEMERESKVLLGKYGKSKTLRMWRGLKHIHFSREGGLKIVVAQKRGSKFVSYPVEFDPPYTAGL